MKRFIAMFVLLLVAGMSLPATLAAEPETGIVTAQAEAEATADTTAADTDTTIEATAAVDAETAAEIEDMDTESGKEMRLLQLQHQLEVKAEQARAVIARLEADARITANQSAELEATAVQLDALAGEAADAIANLESQSSQEAVEAFLAIKAEGKALVADFRAKVHAYVGEDEREEIREETRNVETRNEARIKMRIKEARDEHNAVRAEMLLSTMGVASVEEFVAQIRSGEITAEDIRTRVKARFEELPEEQRERAADRLREEHTKIKIAARATIDETKIEIREKREEILREQIERIENSEAKARLETRLKILESGGIMSGMRTETRTEIRDGETRIEVREKTRSDGTIERRERVREDNSGSDDETGSDDVKTESDDDVRTESDLTVEVRT